MKPMNQQVASVQQQPGMVMGQPGVVIKSSETSAVILLALGFCVPCLWFVPVCLYGTKHPNSSTRTTTKISLVLAILSVIAWALYLVRWISEKDSYTH